jgi:hypothetical protein
MACALPVKEQKPKAILDTALKKAIGTDKMARGRRPEGRDKIQKLVQLPRELVARVDLLLPPNPLTGGPKMGDWSKLVERLLRDWIESELQEQERRDRYI